MRWHEELVIHSYYHTQQPCPLNLIIRFRGAGYFLLNNEIDFLLVYTLASCASG